MIRDEIKKLIASATYTDKADVVLEHHDDKVFGDYSSNIAMRLAREQKKKPMEIAENIKKTIVELKVDYIEKIEVANPGYINFYLSKECLQGQIIKIIEEKEKFGELYEKKEKIMVEYSQPNTHKEFHIGHLRNVFIGSALVEVLRKAKYDVVSANYIGDTGSHIAKCLWGIEKFHSNENLDDINDKAEFLGKIYFEAVRAIEKNPEYEKEFKELQNKFDQDDPTLQALWEKTKQWSLNEFKKIYELLGIQFDVYFFESEEEVAGKKMVADLLAKKVAERSQEAIVVNLEQYDLGVLVLVRKDGSALYGLKDIPLAVKKFKEFNIDTSIYIIDIRQNLYLNQLFKILELYGLREKMVHIGYEVVTLKDGESMSSRKGNIITARELIDEIDNRVKSKFPDSPDSLTIALGALKFSMLRYSANKKIEFDINESIKIEGATGPYVQYAHARICSILAKAQSLKLEWQSKNNLSLLSGERELNLMRELNKFPELVEEVSQSYEVHKLTYFAIKLADKFHSFYNDCRVIDESNLELTQSRLELAKAVKIVLAETLRLIGVSALEKM